MPTKNNSNVYINWGEMIMGIIELGYFLLSVFWAVSGIFIIGFLSWWAFSAYKKMRSNKK